MMIICCRSSHNITNNISLKAVTLHAYAGSTAYGNNASMTGVETQTPGHTGKENHKSVLRRSWYRICIFRHTSKVPCAESDLLGQYHHMLSSQSKVRRPWVVAKEKNSRPCCKTIISRRFQDGYCCASILFWSWSAGMLSVAAIIFGSSGVLPGPVPCFEVPDPSCGPGVSPR